jgi:small nuclear ribonucleoprotein (snRNP)-like protein
MPNVNLEFLTEFSTHMNHILENLDSLAGSGNKNVRQALQNKKGQSIMINPETLAYQANRLIQVVFG